jgi:16S rRNA U516 pseudouridylate synthase RsuA-like enzyme
VDGKPLLRNVARLYFAVNKPKGYLCASSVDANAAGAKRLVIDLLAVRRGCMQCAGQLPARPSGVRCVRRSGTRRVAAAQRTCCDACQVF